MDTPPPDLRSVFDGALERPDGPERDGYLDEACGGDASLRARVEALLRAHDEAGDFLASPPTSASGGPGAPDDSPRAEPPVQGVGSRVGPYRLLQQIGEGGMGVVYLAEQERPVHRRVALKVIRAGMDSAQVVRRFEAERQALALMDHPNIARVLDAGTTDSGRPYFVMELVKGVPITDYCDAARLSPKGRLELFIPVCQAIQHAHQKGVIHRDVKPSNILVTLVDGHPVPKVIDFGVAKAVERRLTDRTLFTQFGAIVGTPEYMSPEQAGIASVDVDTRSDVYSLGVLLYELLTGSTPLERETLRSAAFAEIMRRIREEEPPRPSTRLSGSGDRLASLSAVRQTEPARLTRLVRGDLDWIVMKALDKDRARRYETAAGLAKDVRRYLDGDAVDAGPPSARYRLGKFARKHRAGLATAAAFAVLLVAATAVSTVLAVRASAALNESDRARREAEAVSGFLVDAFRKPEEKADGTKLRVVEVLDAAVKGLDADSKMPPAIKGRLLHVLGMTYGGLGQWLRSKEAEEKALKVREGALGPAHRDTLESRARLVYYSALTGAMDEAVTMARAALAACEAALEPWDEVTIQARNYLGAALWWAGKMGDEAVPLAEGTIRLCEGRYPEASRIMTNNRFYLWEAYTAAGRPADALRQARLIAAGMEAWKGQDHPWSLHWRSEVRRIEGSGGRGKAESAEERQERARGSLESLDPDDSQAILWRADLAVTRYNKDGQGDPIAPLQALLRVVRVNNGDVHPQALDVEKQLAWVRLQRGQYAEGLAALEDVVARFDAKFPRGQFHAIRARECLAAAYYFTGRYEEGLRLAEAMGRDFADRAPDDPDALAAADLRSTLLIALGRCPEGIALAERTLALAGKKFGDDDAKTYPYRATLAAGRTLSDPSRRAEAADVWEAMVKVLGKSLGNEDHEVIANSLYLSDFSFEAGRLERAAELYDEWLPREPHVLDRDWFEAQGYGSRRGELLIRQGKYAEAERRVVEGFEFMKAHESRIQPVNRPRLAEAGDRVVRLYEAWARPDKAAEWRARIQSSPPRRRRPGARLGRTRPVRRGPSSPSGRPRRPAGSCRPSGAGPVADGRPGRGQLARGPRAAAAE